MALVLPLLLALAQAGHWEGALELPNGGKLRLRVHMAANGEGSMDSVDQGTYGLKLDEIRVAEGKLTWKLGSLRASYEGTAAGEGFTGTFTQNGLPLKLDLKKIDAPAPLKRPQTPKPPFPYRSEEVTFASKADGVTLAGTLTRPEGAGPFPGVVLITGSGRQDRDETIFDHRPFAVIADYLTRRGMAVLRYDDRGTGKSTGRFGGSTTADFALDAEGAFDFLRGRVGPKIGFIGHSEGGVIAPMIAARRAGDVAFMVLMAGTGVTGEQVLYEQVAAISKANKAPEMAIEIQRSMQEMVYEGVRKDLPQEELLKRVREKFGSAPGLEQMVKQAADPWFRFFLKYDPAPTLEKVRCPVLVLNGELDLQVLPEQNVPAIEAALKRGGNKAVTVKRLPKLNHLFQTATTGSVAEYVQIEETVAPAALEAMGDC